MDHHHHHHHQQQHHHHHQHQQGERSGVQNYEMQVSYSTTPQGIHEMGFVQFEENQVMSFLAPPQPQSPPPPPQPPSSSSAQITATTSTPTNTSSMGFTHNDLLTRPSWNNDQVIYFKKINK